MVYPLLFCLDQYLFNMNKYRLILTAILLHFCSLGQLTNEFITLKPLYVNSIQFNYTGSIQSWTVPTNVTSIKVEVYGAAGGDLTNLGGYGGRVIATFAVIPGATYYLTVGGKPLSSSINTPLYGFGGEGGVITNFSSKAAAGGGLSGISTSAPITQSNSLVIAGGGGGATYGWIPGVGGYGGGLNGGNGSNGSSYGGVAVYGKGGTQLAGGAAASVLDANQTLPTSGSALNGGRGGSATGSSAGWNGGGGGGGGYFGGGGGAAGGNACGGGGGGSSYTSSSAINILNDYGINASNGKIIIYY